MTKEINQARHRIDGVSVFCAFDEIVEIKNLKENPRNPNTHPTVQLELLAQIIKKTGWRAPITVSTLSGYIVKGHGRLQAAKLAGFKHCPVEYQTFKDEEEELAALLADNRIAEISEIDNKKLLELLQEFDVGEIDFYLSGYTEEFYKELAAAFDEYEGPKLEDCETEMPQLASGDKAPFQQMTFTLADSQAEVIKQAIEEIKKTEQYKYVETYGNENSNGNALFCIIERYLNE